MITKGAITSKIKHAIKHTIKLKTYLLLQLVQQAAAILLQLVQQAAAIKHKTSSARLAQLLQPSLAFCFSLQPMTAYSPVLDHVIDNN